MSEQEMQFADPDWQPGQAGTPTNQVLPRFVNGQRSSSILPAMQPIDAGEREYRGYAGIEYAEIGEKVVEQRGYLRPQPRHNRMSPWLWVGIVVFALIFIAGLAQGYQSSNGFNVGLYREQRVPSMNMPGGFPSHNGQQFKVGSFPTINVVNLVGSITVVAGGPPGVVTVLPSRSHGFGDNGQFQNSAIQASQSANGGTVTVNVNDANAAPEDVLITVPLDANLTLHTNGGDISVGEVTGQMTLSSGSGSIELDGVTLQQHSSIQTNSGDINFSGALDSQGSYQLTSNSGAITVGLDGGTSYHLYAKTQSGIFTASGAVTAASSGNKGSYDIQTDVGYNPQASLTLQTQTGDITLQT